MGDNTREELIHSLAESMGAMVRPNYAASKFDDATGTFYCNGHVFGQRTIDQAATYFNNIRQTLEPGSDTAMFYELATESIKYLQRKNKLNEKMVFTDKN